MSASSRSYGPHSRSSSVAGALASSAPHGRELLVVGQVRGRRDRELAVVEVVARARERQRLDGFADERRNVTARVARRRDDLAVPHGDRVHAVARLDGRRPARGYPDRLSHEDGALSARAARDGGLAPRARRPGVGLSDREGRTGAHRDAEDLRPAAGRRSRAGGSRAPAAREAAALPDRGRRARPARPPDDRRPPALPARRARRARRRRRSGSGSRAARELVLTEAGTKKRAGVWLLTPEAAAAELAHLGPEAPRLGRRAARRDPRARTRGGCTRCSATSARSPASAAPGRTRSSTRRSCRPYALLEGRELRGGRSGSPRRSTSELGARPRAA